MAEQHRCLAGDACVTVGSVRRDLLVADVDELDGAVRHGGEHRDVRVSAEPEDPGHPSARQVVDQLLGDRATHAEPRGGKRSWRRPAVHVGSRVDPAHRGHRRELLRNVRHHTGHPRCDEDGVGEFDREVDLGEDRGVDAIDVDRQPTTRGGFERAFDRDGGVDVRPLDAELASHREQPVDAWVSLGVLAMSEAGESTPVLSTCGDDVGGGLPRSVPAVARSATSEIALMASPTAAAWNWPMASRPAAAPAWNDPPPVMTVRAASTEGVPGPWSTDATMRASSNSAAAGVGSSPA